MAIPFIHVQAKGDYRELGRAVGEAAREQVRASVDFFVEHFEAMTRGRLTFAAARERRPWRTCAQARRWLPQYVDELEGVAEGAGLPFSHLLVLNCGEEFTSDEPVAGEAAADGTTAGDGAGDRAGRPRRAAEHCTRASRAIMPAGGAPRRGPQHGLVRDRRAPTTSSSTSRSPDGTRLMGIAGAPYLLMLGMNSHGVGNVSNSVHSTDDRVGVPNAFVRRWTLEAETLEEARARGLLAARARGTNHFLADTGGRLWDVETSATAQRLRRPLRRGVHGAHEPLRAAEMAPFEGSRIEESRMRLATAERLLAEGVARG